MKRMFKFYVLAVFIFVTSAAQASLVNYRLTINRELVHNLETLGGASTPVVLDFIVDTELLPITSLANFTQYHFSPLAVSVGDVTTILQIPNTNTGFVSLSNQEPGSPGAMDSINVYGSGYDDGTRINGRSLFVASFVLWDANAEMFGDHPSLPLDTNFYDPNRFGGNLQLIFRPEKNDPEYQNDIVRFGAFFAPGDLTIRITKIPEPVSLSLVGLGLVGCCAVRRRRGRLHEAT